MPWKSSDLGIVIPAPPSAPKSQPIRPSCRCAPILPTNLFRPPLTPSIRLPRNPIGSLMMSPITLAARDRTFISMSLSFRIVCTTPTTASSALLTKPLLAAWSSSMRASSASRDSTYFCASLSTSASCFASTSDVSCSNWLSSLSAASLPTSRRSAGSWATYFWTSARPCAIRVRAAVSSVPTMSATSPMTPSIAAR